MLTTLTGWIKKSAPVRTQDDLVRRAGSRVASYCAPRQESRATDAASEPVEASQSTLAVSENASPKTMTPAEQLTAELAALMVLQPAESVNPKQEANQFVYRRRASDQSDAPAVPVPITETRFELLNRLLDPYINLAEAAKLLNAPSEAVVDYVNRNMLPSLTGIDKQPRFRLSQVLALLEVLEPSFAAMSYVPSEEPVVEAHEQGHADVPQISDVTLSQSNENRYNLNDMINPRQR